MRKLKRLFKKRKNGASLSFPPYFNEIDKVFSCRDLKNLPENLETGMNSCSQMEKDNIEGDSDGDVDLLDVAKRVPKEICDFGIESGVCQYWLFIISASL